MLFKRKKIGDILYAAGLISDEQLAEALKKQKETKGRLGKVLLEMGFLSEEELIQGLSEQLHVPRVNLDEVDVPAQLLGSFPKKFLVDRQVVPVSQERTILKLAMVDPLDYVTINEVQFMSGKTVQPLITASLSVERFLEKSSGKADNVNDALKKIYDADAVEVVEDADMEDDDDILRLKKAGEAAPIISMVNMILSEAVKANASDVHIEPRPKDVLVRYRIDGLLKDMTTVPSYVHLPIVSRIKIMAKMDIAVRRRPLDGSTKVKMGDKEIDLRVSTLPTLYGEKMVVRILDKNKTVMTLEDMGMPPEDLAIFRSFLARPQGMVLVTGPTGSGKSTTLYASLMEVRSEGVNIITIEDPVEYQLPGINQVNVNEKSGITFATGLRSLLRQDPNIIMVGEIRDRETAVIAFQAALTGHLVLSTLHTNNAIAAITRLVDVGIEPYIVASSVVGVVAQRLVRRNCPRCLAPYKPSTKLFADLGLPLEKGSDRYAHGTGCDECHNVGYRGRVGIYEVFKIDDAIRELIINQASEKKILSAAKASGMTVMEEDGLRKAAQHITTLEEVLRVIPPQEFGDTKQSVIRDKVTSSDDSTSDETRVNETAGHSAKNTDDESKSEDLSLPAIILVEGSRNNMKGLVAMLQKDGYSCAVVSKVKEVQELLSKNPSSLVVSDILLQEITIIELEKIIRGKKKTAHIQLLGVLRGKKSLEVVENYKFDRNRLIERPFKISDVRKKIAQAAVAER